MRRPLAPCLLLLAAAAAVVGLLRLGARDADLWSACYADVRALCPRESPSANYAANRLACLARHEAALQDACRALLRRFRTLP